MKLSEINTSPLYQVTIPSSKKKVKYRPFVVREERALLAAQESEDETVMLDTMNQVVTNCLTPTPTSLTTFDLEYLFTLIRAKSVGEYSELIFRCDACVDEKAKVKVSLDLRKVEVHTPENHTNKIKISDTVTVVMRYPSVEEITSIQKLEEAEAKTRAILASMETIYAEDDTYHVNEEPESELMAFMESLTGKQYAMIETFFDTMPVVRIAVEYRCPVCGTDHKKQVKGLTNFF